MRSVIAALVLSTACCTPDYSGDAPREVSQVWRVNVGDGSHGTGFAVKCTQKPNGRYQVLVLTAKHVSSHTEGLSATLRTEYLFRGREVAHHPTRDVCLIEFESTKPVKTLSLRPETTYAGEKLWVAGYGGDSFWVNSGYASAVDRASVPVFSGDSGSPLLDREGLVVGLVTHIRCYSVPWSLEPHLVHHHCLFVPTASLIEWLQPLLD